METMEDFEFLGVPSDPLKGAIGYVRQVGRKPGDITHKSHGYKSSFSGLRTTY